MSGGSGLFRGSSGGQEVRRCSVAPVVLVGSFGSEVQRYNGSTGGWCDAERFRGVPRFV